MSLACVTSTTIDDRRPDGVRHRAGTVHQGLLHRRRPGDQRHPQRTGLGRAPRRLQHHPRAGPVVERLRREPAVRERGRRPVDHERIADLDDREGVRGVHRADVDPEVLDRRGAAHLGVGHEVLRALADHAGHVARPGAHGDVLADQHLRIPAAERADAQEPVVVGVLVLHVRDDQADLVEMAEQQNRRPVSRPDAGEGVAGTSPRRGRRAERTRARPRRPAPRGPRGRGRAGGRPETPGETATWPGRYHHQRVDPHQVVITGIGALTPVGTTIAETWEALKAGTSGLGPVTLFDPSRINCEVAAEVKGFDAEDASAGARRARWTASPPVARQAAREAWASRRARSSTRRAAASSSAPASAACDRDRARRAHARRAARPASRRTSCRTSSSTRRRATSRPTSACAAPTSPSSRPAPPAPTRSAWRPRCCAAATPTRSSRAAPTAGVHRAARWPGSAS